MTLFYDLVGLDDRGQILMHGPQYESPFRFEAPSGYFALDELVRRVWETHKMHLTSLVVNPEVSGVEVKFEDSPRAKPRRKNAKTRSAKRR